MRASCNRRKYLDSLIFLFAPPEECRFWQHHAMDILSYLLMTSHQILFFYFFMFYNICNVPTYLVKKIRLVYQYVKVCINIKGHAWAVSRPTTGQFCQICMVLWISRAMESNGPTSVLFGESLVGTQHCTNLTNLARCWDDAGMALA